MIWSNVEHTAADPVLPPEPGWMQGTAGVAAALLRYARVRRDGYDAARVPLARPSDMTSGLTAPSR